METNPVSPRQRYEGLRDKNMMRTGGKCMMGFKGCCCCCSFDSVVSDSVRPHRRQPTRLPRPWDSPGKNIGVGCHSLLQCVKVKSLSHVRLLVTPWTAAHQAPPFMGSSRQEYWSGVPSPSDGTKCSRFLKAPGSLPLVHLCPRSKSHPSSKGSSQICLVVVSC